MNLIELEINFASQQLILTNQRALYWPKHKSLILSDLHLGKAAHFRKNGIALPIQISLQDIRRLDFLMDHYQPEKLIVVGDLLHSGNNKELEFFRNLTQKFHDVKFILIRGNHDHFPLAQLKNFGVSEVYDELFIENIKFLHQPSNELMVPAICGHIHPGITVQLPTKRFMKFPCFAVGENKIILPAFSDFTGLDTKSIQKDFVFYAFYEDGIFKVSQ